MWEGDQCGDVEVKWENDNVKITSVIHIRSDTK
jgi:hypothetical protein